MTTVQQRSYKQKKQKKTQNAQATHFHMGCTSQLFVSMATLTTKTADEDEASDKDGASDGDSTETEDSIDLC